MYCVRRCTDVCGCVWRLARVRVPIERELSLSMRNYTPGDGVVVLSLHNDPHRHRGSWWVLARGVDRSQVAFERFMTGLSAVYWVVHTPHTRRQALQQ